MIPAELIQQSPYIIDLCDPACSSEIESWGMHLTLNFDVMALMALCAGNHPVNGEFPVHREVFEAMVIIR